MSLTSDGLYIIADNSDWKVRISSDGVYIIDANGTTVAQYGENIILGAGDDGNAQLVLSSSEINVFSPEGAPTFVTASSSDTISSVLLGLNFWDMELQRDSSNVIAVNTDKIDTGTEFTVTVQTAKRTISRDRRGWLDKAELTFTKGTTETKNYSINVISGGTASNPTLTAITGSIYYNASEATITVNVPSFTLNPITDINNEFYLASANYTEDSYVPETRMRGYIYFGINTHFEDDLSLWSYIHNLGWGSDVYE